jgi:hypothetical protein
VEALIRVMQQTSVPLMADCLRVCESQLDRHTADAMTCVPVKSQLTAQTGASVRGTLERRDTLPTIVYTPVGQRGSHLLQAPPRVGGACVETSD